MSRTTQESVFTKISEVTKDGDGYIHVKDPTGLVEVLIGPSTNGVTPSQVKAGMCITFEYMQASGCSMLTSWTVEEDYLSCT